MGLRMYGPRPLQTHTSNANRIAAHLKGCYSRWRRAKYKIGTETTSLFAVILVRIVIINITNLKLNLFWLQGFKLLPRQFCTESHKINFFPLCLKIPCVWIFNTIENSKLSDLRRAVNCSAICKIATYGRT